MFKVFIHTLFHFFIMMSKALWRRLPRNIFRVPRHIAYLALWTTCSLLALLVMGHRSLIAFGLYTWFRHSDDILDGDDPHQPKDMADFIKSKTRTLEMCLETRCPEPFSGVDRVLQNVLWLAQKNNPTFDFKRYVRQMWKLMLEEHVWKSTTQVLSREELRTFAAEQDEIICGLTALLIGVSEQDLSKFTFWRSGTFTHCDWVSDIERDLSSGQVHISKEDAESLGMDIHQFASGHYDGRTRDQVSTWVRVELNRLKPELALVAAEKKAFLATFPNWILAKLYDTFLLKMLEKEITKVYKKHGVAITGRSFSLPREMAI